MKRDPILENPRTKDIPQGKHCVHAFIVDQIDRGANVNPSSKDDDTSNQSRLLTRRTWALSEEQDLGEHSPTEAKERIGGA